ncbi:MAG: dimethyl sulfoxide reductase anchor subunit [Hyphomicrobiales bacterium]|nr:dimethyl sulfoxide reductase anchor subunit [Hyphomicrobiales bacterium]
MHPAYSVIFFTTASGAGYGLLILAAIFAVGGLLPATGLLGLVLVGLALALIGGGLLSSTFHLGRPERAVNALSQWRTSWLSREGVLAIATFLPAGLFAVGWVFLGKTTGFFGWMGVAAALLAVLTVFSTSMIYASLTTIPQWNLATVPMAYLALGLMSGAVLLAFVTRLFGVHGTAVDVVAIAAILIGWGVKTAYWTAIDGRLPESDLGSATGLGRFGAVRILEQPHTEANFLMHEMGYRVARKHARRLRSLAHVGLFALPLLFVVAGLFAPEVTATAMAAGAVLALVVGLLTERWLFFAEARHDCMIWYGR